MTARLAVLQLATALAAGQVRHATAGPVGWSWATPQYFVHCSNDTGPLNAAMLSVIGNASFTVVEKWQCLYCQPNSTGAEAKMIAAADQIRARNPDAPVFLYWQADWARRWYDDGVWFDAHPELELHSADGTLFVDTSGGASGGPWHAYDFSNAASVAKWAGHIAETYAKGAFDGVLIDGVKAECPDVNATAALTKAFVTGKAASGTVLRAALPPGAHLLANDDPRPSGYTGTMLEFFQGTNESINRLLGLKGTFVEVHATSRGSDFNMSLAAYLVCAEEGMYFGAANGRFGGWKDCAGWGDPTITAQYTKPLGEPLGTAVWDPSAATWSRKFASGTRVEVSPAGRPPGGGKRLRGASCVWWADGTTLGSAC